MKLVFLIIYLFNLTYGNTINTTSTIDLVYNFTNGFFECKQINVLNKTVHKLLGVPYADLPLPFKKPMQTKLKNQNITLADKWPQLCLHPLIFHNNFYGNFKLPLEYEMTLNCLTINIFIPINSDNKKPNNLTAMFFIHGGSNAAGTSSFIDGSALASVGNVVVAMPNYRLDVLGFFNKKNSSFKGNYGLWDQLEALKWLYNNCESIGCNKNSITLFGHSAGSGDTLLLSLSKHAQPYINRIIMQSGSGLAHWSFVYETHILEKLNTYKSKKSKKELLKMVKFDKTKYINSLNDTFNNFVSITTCNLTSKYKCLKSKIHNFSRYLSNVNLENTNPEYNFIMFVKNLLETLDLNEFFNLIGYLHKSFIEVFDQNEFKSVYFDYVFNDSSFFVNYNLNTSDEFYFNFMNRSNFDKKFDFEALNKANQNTSSCYPDLTMLFSSSDSLILTCEFLKEYNKNYTFLYQSQTIKYFLECFKIYYKSENDLQKNSDILDSLLFIKTDLISKEVESCLIQATNIYQLYLNGTFKNLDNSLTILVNSTLKETSFLTENSNYVYRANLDYDLFNRLPHVEIADNTFLNKEIDTLIGITSHESFYFLLHEYNLNDILIHTFVYSSLLNLTDNLINKLIELNSNKDLNYCVKRSLLDYYKIKLTDSELDRNGLKNKFESLEFISDYDFVLPLITQLKAYLNINKNNNTNKSLYVYEYSHISSFNYLLDHMRSFYVTYETALKNLNHSVSPHFSELDFVFGLPILSKSNLIKIKNDANVSENNLLYNYTQSENEFSNLIIKYWSNFAKFGNPNSNDTKHSQWESFNNTHRNIFNLNAIVQELDYNLFDNWLEKHKYWYEIIPNKVYDECYFLNNIEKTETFVYKEKEKFFEIFTNSATSFFKQNKHFFIALKYLLIIFKLFVEDFIF